MSSNQAIRQLLSQFTSYNKENKGRGALLEMFVNDEIKDHHEKCLLNTREELVVKHVSPYSIIKESTTLFPFL